MGAAAALMAGAKAMEIFGTIQQGRAADKMGKYNQRVLNQNADIAERNALWASQAGEQQVATQQYKSRAEAGAITTSQAVSGIDINKGSAVDVRASSVAKNMLDSQNIRAEATRKAYGYQVQASDLRSQGEVARAEGKNARDQAYMKATSTALSSAASGSGGFANFLASKSINDTAGQNIPWANGPDMKFTSTGV